MSGIDFRQPSLLPSCILRFRLALAELAPDVKEHDESDEEQAKDQHRRGAAVRREKQRESETSEEGAMRATAVSNAARCAR